jgi:hypothetical protein
MILLKPLRCNCSSLIFITFSLGLDGFWFSLALAGIVGCISIYVFVRLSNQYGQAKESIDLAAVQRSQKKKPKKKRVQIQDDVEMDGKILSLTQHT